MHFAVFATPVPAKGVNRFCLFNKEGSCVLENQNLETFALKAADFVYELQLQGKTTHLMLQKKTVITCKSDGTVICTEGLSAEDEHGFRTTFSDSLQEKWIQHNQKQEEDAKETQRTIDNLLSNLDTDSP